MVFSGHTMMLCLYSLVWHTYFKRAPGLRFNYVKIAAWSTTCVGCVAILAVRMHYTLVKGDV